MYNTKNDDLEVVSVDLLIDTKLVEDKILENLKKKFKSDEEDDGIVEDEDD